MMPVSFIVVTAMQIMHPHMHAVPHFHTLDDHKKVVRDAPHSRTQVHEAGASGQAFVNGTAHDLHATKVHTKARVEHTEREARSYSTKFGNVTVQRLAQVPQGVTRHSGEQLPHSRAKDWRRVAGSKMKPL